jgi:hypothetical protein
MSRDIDKSAFADHTFAVLFLQLFGCCVKNYDFMPDRFILVMYGKRESGDMSVTV